MYEIQGWLKSKGFSGFNNDWCSRLADLNFSDQVLFIRKLIECHRLGKFEVTTDLLVLLMKNKKATISKIVDNNKRDRYGNKVFDADYNKGIDISIYFILQCLYTILREKRIPYIMELYRTLSFAYETQDNIEKFKQLLERLHSSAMLNGCHPQRSKLTLRRKSSSRESRAVLILENDKATRFCFKNKADASLYWATISNEPNVTCSEKENEIVISTTPDSFVNVVGYLFWAIKETLMDIAIQLGTEAQKQYMLSFQEPYGIKFCEGHDADEPHKLFCKPFKWCGGTACFGCEGMQYCRPGDYKNYTIYDFIRIISPNYISKTEILKWYSAINRFYTQKEHLFCNECMHMLEPVYWNKQAKTFLVDYHNAHYATWFTCNNPSCSKKEDVIYLNHCFSKYCHNIIDSRETTKCENGFYICKKCGVCCSEEQFKLKSEAGLLSARIKYLINNHKMHLDGGKEKVFFCPKCGKKLIKHTTREFDELDTSMDKEKIWWECPDHSDYIGVFPRTYETKEENDSILTLLDYMDYHYLE